MRLAIGAAQLGMHYGISNQTGKTSLQEAAKIINLAKAHSIDCIDTAIAYGDSESVLGGVGVKEFKVITKIPPVNTLIGSDNSQLSDMVMQSLQKLGLSSLYGLLVHDVSQLNSENGVVLYESMRQLKKLKIVDKIGISAYAPDEISMLIDEYEFDIVQLPFNIFDNRLIASGLLEKLKLKNIEVHVRSVFLQGLLLMEPANVPQKFSRWKKDFECLNAWIKSNYLTRLGACLAYVKSFKEIDRIIVGVESEAQLSEILGSYEIVSMSDFPKFEINDELLINPGKWSEL